MRVLFALLNVVRRRLVPALITALGVVVITAGLLAYTDPTTAGADPTASPIGDAATPSTEPRSSSEPPSETPSDGPSGSPDASPTAAAGATPTATPAGRVVATRVVVPALQIDLPIVQAPSGYPYCNVAMYFTDQRLGQPGQGRATYLFAHARDGMFGPIYNLAIVLHTPNRMVGMIVQVYTSDNMLYLYEITKVMLHQLNLDAPMAAKAEQLWLQTSEGYHIPGKTQVIAMPLSVGQADPADAHPKAHPVVCG